MAKLIVIDKSKNITYFGGCRVQFNGIQKYLNLKMINEDETVLSISFDYNFIKKQNLLCAFDDVDENNDKIMVIFKKTENCITIFDAIVKEKVKNNECEVINIFDEDETFKSDFLIPMINGIQSGIPQYMDLRSIIFDFVNSLENDEKLLYFNFLTDVLLIPSAIQNTVITEHCANGGTIGECSHRKRPFNCIGCKEPSNAEHDSNNAGLTSNKRTCVTSCPSSKTTNHPNPAIFDIVEYWRNGKVAAKLLLFTSNERKQCYEYYFLKSRPSYRCIECLKLNRFVDIKFTVDEEGRKTYHFDAPQNHICKPFEYSPENYGPSLIVKSPNFEILEPERSGNMYPNIMHFNSEDKKSRYRLQYLANEKKYFCNPCREQKVRFTARIITFEGEDAIELGCSKHVCG